MADGPAKLITAAATAAICARAATFLRLPGYPGEFKVRAIVKRLDVMQLDVFQRSAGCTSGILCQVVPAERWPFWGPWGTADQLGVMPVELQS